MKFMLVRLAMASVWIICAYKWGDWKNLRKYYPTLLFFGMGDLIYNVVFYEKPLWRFETDFLVPSLNEVFVIFGIFFPSILIYLSKYPRRLYHQIVYVVFWIALYSGIEIFTIWLMMIKSYNGWNIWWSIFHNTIQFPLVALHQKRPALAWIIALVFLFAIMYVFKLPFTV